MQYHCNILFFDLPRDPWIYPAEEMVVVRQILNEGHDGGLFSMEAGKEV